MTCSINSLYFSSQGVSPPPMLVTVHLLTTPYYGCQSHLQLAPLSLFLYYQPSAALGSCWCPFQCHRTAGTSSLDCRRLSRPFLLTQASSIHAVGSQLHFLPTVSCRTSSSYRAPHQPAAWHLVAEPGVGVLVQSQT